MITRPLRQPGGTEHLDDGTEGRRRYGQVKQPLRATADLHFGTVDGRDQPGRVVWVGGREGQDAFESARCLLGRLDGRKLRDRLPRMFFETDLRWCP